MCRCCLRLFSLWGFTSGVVCSSSSHEQLNHVHVESRTTNFKSKENWSTMIDLQLFTNTFLPSLLNVARQSQCRSPYFTPWSQVLGVLTCQVSVQCSHVLHTGVGRPSGSKLVVRPPVNPCPAHTAPELNPTHTINKHVIIYSVSPGNSSRRCLRILTRCGGPLRYAVGSPGEEFIFTEAAVLVGLEVFVCRHALHQPTHRSPWRLRKHTKVLLH